jgi:ribulose bisphosphate carboxylase small subunit
MGIHILPASYLAETWKQGSEEPIRRLLYQGIKPGDQYTDVRKKEKVLGHIKVGLAIIRHKEAVQRVVEGVSCDDVTGSGFGRNREY